MITNVQECIKPISYIKTNAADMMNFVNDKKEPLIITQNGESRAVLIDVESYQEMKDAFNLLKIIQFSEMDVRAGRTKPATEVFSTGGVTGAEPPLERVVSNEVRARGRPSPSNFYLKKISFYSIMSA